MPDDSVKLNNEAMYGASRSMQVLRSHVGIGSFIEYLSVATRTIVQITSVVTGILHTSVVASVRLSPGSGMLPNIQLRTTSVQYKTNLCDPELQPGHSLTVSEPTSSN